MEVHNPFTTLAIASIIGVSSSVPTNSSVNPCVQSNLSIACYQSSYRIEHPMTTDYSSTHWDSSMYNDQDVADIFNEFLGKFVENMSEPDIDAERILEDNLWDLV